MSTSTCKHSHTVIAASLLVKHGHIGGYEAVYDLVCPSCGVKRRNTRLAATIHSLRHTFGWDITTRERAGMLAEYVLVERRDYPRLIWEGPLVSPIRGLAPTTVDDVPEPQRWACANVIDPKRDLRRECGLQTAESLSPLLGGWAVATCAIHGKVPHRPLKEKK